MALSLSKGGVGSLSRVVNRKKARTKFELKRLSEKDRIASRTDVGETSSTHVVFKFPNRRLRAYGGCLDFKKR
jgi:hypothetical protein